MNAERTRKGYLRIAGNEFGFRNFRKDPHAPLIVGASGVGGANRPC